MGGIAARSALLRKELRRCHFAWHQVVVAAAFERRCAAERHYGRGLARRALQWWCVGSAESKLERDFEAHKRILQAKVSGWLHEIDAGGPLRPRPRGGNAAGAAP